MRDCYVISRYSSMSVDPYCVVLTIEDVEKIVKIDEYNTEDDAHLYEEFVEFKNGYREWSDGERWSVHRVSLRGEL